MKFLKETNPHNIDTPEATIRHREIILSKPFLKKIYAEWYNAFINEIPKLPEGKILEIGSGSGFLKEMYPNAITSDIQKLPFCDMVFSAEKIPFQHNELSAIFMINVLHHIPKCENFFSEAQRTLKPGGFIFMMEPANTFLSKIIYSKLHHEPFDAKAGWEFPSSGPLSGANVALPWIVFKRDIDLFHQKFPKLKLSFIRHNTPFRYLFSGGLSYKSLLPGLSFRIVSFIEKIFFPLYPYLAMYNYIKVTKEQE